MPSDTTVAESKPYGWDWSATTHDPFDDAGTLSGLIESCAAALGGAHVLPVGKGIHGWTDSLEVFDCDGYRLGKVYFGGKRQDVFVVSSSSAADVVRGDVAELHHGKTARVDTRVDSLVPFDELTAILEDAASGKFGPPSLITRVESSMKGESNGRTVYLGSPTSAVRVRLYEKWLESPGQYEDGTNRVEVQLRPPSKAKRAVSSWSRAQTFGASKVARHLAERLGKDLEPAESLHVNRGTPDLQRSIEAMGKQYRKAVDRWLEVSEGDLSSVLHHLGVTD